jgi:ABC-type transport system involved in multi-copper enzyme maturation permease subunit
VELVPGEGQILNVVVTTEPNPETRLFWPHQVRLLFGLIDMDEGPGQSLGSIVFFIENYLVNGVVAWVTILLGIVITANFFPNMLRKGSIDLMLVRPLHRIRLLLFKYLAGVVYILVNFALLVTALWLVVGLRTGIWRPGVLLSIGAMTFFFAILYSVSALYGLLTRSPTVAILVSCVAWFGCWLVGTLYAYADASRKAPTLPEWAYPVLDVLHYLVPRTGDLNVLMSKVLSSQLLSPSELVGMDMANLPAIQWSESLTIAGGFVALLLGVSCWRFWRRDY